MFRAEQRTAKGQKSETRDINNDSGLKLTNENSQWILTFSETSSVIYKYTRQQNPSEHTNLQSHFLHNRKTPYEKDKSRTQDSRICAPFNIQRPLLKCNNSLEYDCTHNATWPLNWHFINSDDNGSFHVNFLRLLPPIAPLSDSRGWTQSVKWTHREGTKERGQRELSPSRTSKVSEINLLETELFFFFKF